MAGYRSNGRARRQVPSAQPTRSAQDRLGPSYTPVVWSCDRCGAAITNQDQPQPLPRRPGRDMGAYPVSHDWLGK